jgi:hypothetical protein
MPVLQGFIIIPPADSSFDEFFPWNEMTGEMWCSLFPTSSVMGIMPDCGDEKGKLVQ